MTTRPPHTGPRPKHARRARRFAGLLAGLLAGPIAATAPAQTPGPVIIAHRGASGYLPEHTLAAYAAAHAMGADYIEPDVVLSKDNVPVCLHDLTLEATTDCEEKLPGRARADGHWYALDFTLAELKTLNKTGHHTPNATGHTVATLTEMLALVNDLNTRTGRRVGVIPEPKGPAFHRDAGQPIEPVLLAALSRAGYGAADDACIVQVFESASIVRMKEEMKTDLRMVWLITEEPAPGELETLAPILHGIGPRKALVLTRGVNGRLGESPLVARAKQLSLAVYPWTYGAREDEMQQALAAVGPTGGLFTDFPDVGVRARERGLPRD